MIGYLKGEKIDLIKTPNNRVILILEVNCIGYEMQIPARWSQQLAVESSEEIKVFTHLQIKEDRQILYGFASAAERDLFRQLIGVSGIGAQLAIALIDTLGIVDLVQAIVTSNNRLLVKTPGVGQKTAERISLELKTKLAQWQEVAGIMKTSTLPVTPAADIMDELEMTLLALGYTDKEIIQAVTTIGKDDLLAKNPHVEEWIRSAIAFLSQDTI